MRMQKTLAKILTIIVLTATCMSFGCGRRSGTANANNANSQPQIIDVTTAVVVVKPIPTYFEATGNLASDAQTDVAPAVAGKIAEVNFDVGSFVSKGSVLVRLDARDAQIKLEQAEAQVEQQQKAVEQAVAALQQSRARLGVKPGENFNIETFSQVRSTQANLDLAEKELARSQRLYDTGDVSKSILDQRRSQRDALLGTLDEARSTAAVAVRAINSAEAAVATARTGVTTAQTLVDQARKSITDTVIYSPISGYVLERVADVGEYISPNTPSSKVATIVRTSPLRLRIDVPEQSIARVSVGEGISLQTSAYPDRNFAGTVVRILPGLNVTARTLTVEAEVPNSDGLLKPGQFATVRITQQQPENAVMVPATAVKANGDTDSVFVIKDGAAHEITVQTGLLENGLIQIKQGVAEGDVVATDNINNLADGVFVRQMN
jgi:RND family efflux transporter MFP subunit